MVSGVGKMKSKSYHLNLPALTNEMAMGVTVTMSPTYKLTASTAPDLLPAPKGGGPRGLEGCTPFTGANPLWSTMKERGFFTVEIQSSLWVLAYLDGSPANSLGRAALVP